MLFFFSIILPLFSHPFSFLFSPLYVIIYFLRQAAHHVAPVSLELNMYYVDPAGLRLLPSDETKDIQHHTWHIPFVCVQGWKPKEVIAFPQSWLVMWVLGS